LLFLEIILNQEIKEDMKTVTLIIAIMFFSLINKAQNENNLSKRIHNGKELTTFFQGKLLPVYFNFRKRQLRDADNKTISPMEFLNLCRTINDNAVQLQIARYDAYTKDKQKLGVIAIGSGFSSMGLLGSAGVSSEQGNGIVTGSLAFFGVLAILVIPAVAIYSSVPHQKRKAVLFRDLPIAYNQYVETHQ
jgi:hypothetical protein